MALNITLSVNHRLSGVLSSIAKAKEEAVGEVGRAIGLKLTDFAVENG